MAAEFKVAEAYADFHVNVDAGIDAAVARLKGRAKELSVTAKVVLDADVTEARAKIRALSEDKNKATVKADADTTLAAAKIKALGDTEGKVKVKAEVDETSLAKTGKAVENELGKVAARANAQFSALAFGGLSVGLPAAAAIGVAGVGAVFTAVPALFAVLGVQSQLASDEVQHAMDGLTSKVNSSVTTIGEQFKGPMVEAIDSASTTVSRLLPQFEQAMSGSVKAIEPLTGAVTGFAEEAMPGLVTAIRVSSPVLEGIKNLATQTGAGFTDMSENMANGAINAGAGITQLGGIIRDALGGVGTVMANLANQSSGPLSQLQAMLREVWTILGNITSTGGGVIGFLSGFSQAATGMLTVLSGVTTVLGLLPSEVTQFAGAFAASGMVLSKFGIDAGKAFEGMGKKLDAAKSSSEPLKNSLRELTTAALSPAVLATAGLAIGLEILGQRQRDAAAATQAQRDRVQSLAAALRESNGAITDSVTAQATATLQNFKVSDGYRNLLSDARNLKLGLPDLTAAYLGNKAGLDGLNLSIDAAIKQHTSMQMAGKAVVPVVDEEGKKYQQFRDILNSGDFAKAVQDNKDLATAAGAGAKPLTELEQVMKTLSSTSADAASRVTAVHTALDLLTGRTPEFEDAIKAGNDAIRNLATGLEKGAKAADGMGKSLINADGSINTVKKNGSDLLGLAEGLQTSFINAAGAIETMTKRGVPLADATNQVTKSLQGQRDGFIKVAGQMGINATEAGKLADKYGLIPDKIITDVTANIKTAQAAIDSLPLYAAGVQGAVVISATKNEATGKVDEVVQYADGSIGTISIDGKRDLATNETLVAVQFADGSIGTMTVDGLNKAAKEKTLEAVRNADGSIGTIKVGADTSAAIAKVQTFYDTYIHSVTIPIKAGLPPGGILPLGSNGGATGGLANGGSVQRFADGGFANGPIDVSGGGRMSGPGTPTSDSMLVAVSDTEAIINARETARNVREIAAINSGFRNYEKYPETGRPPENIPQQRAASVGAGPITINIYAQDQDVYELATMVSRELDMRSA